jgi:hypothetical protein
MVKTTVLLDDEIYRGLVDESMRDYGTTKKISFLINKKLRSAAAKPKKAGTKRLTIRLGRRINEKGLEKAIEEGWTEAIKWSV